MPTLSELRSSIKEQMLGYMPTDDSRLEEPFLDHLIRSKRSLIIRERAKFGLGVDQAFYQDLTCLKVERAPIKCDGITTKTEYPRIPVPAVEQFRGSIAYLGKLNFKEPFAQLSLSAFLRSTTSRMCVTHPAYTLLDGYAYLSGLDLDTEIIRMVAVLENPAENKCILNFEDQDYPVPMDASHQLELLCLKQLMSTLPIRPDTSNNAQDDSAPAAPLKPNNL